MHVDETIAAIASSHDGGGLRGIVRISGPQTITYLSNIFDCVGDSGLASDSGLKSESALHGDLPRADGARAPDKAGKDEAGKDKKAWKTCRRATRFPGSLQLGELGQIDCDLYLWPDARSYTRQTTAELHTHGAMPLLQAVVEAVCQHGARLARPGEFTLRAFLAGRIDLAQAEAVLGVIDAVDNRELNVALSQLAGGLSQPLTELRNKLLNLCADIEAGLDFVDEDIQFIAQEQVELQLSDALSIIDDTLNQMRQRNVGEQLPRVVLRGEPNAGKSSLWNALVSVAQNRVVPRRDPQGSVDHDSENQELGGAQATHQAIVSDQAGTTRDYLTGVVDDGAIRFTLIDTAGIEPQNEDALRQMIQQTNEHQVENADVVLLCIDGSRPLTDWERDQLANVTSSVVERIVVQTKCDLDHSTAKRDYADVRISTELGIGLAELRSLCDAKLRTLAGESSVVSTTALRCRESLRQARESCVQAKQLVQEQIGDELVAAELRLALEHLGQVVGVIYNDDILDRVFSRFCIGK